MEEIFNLLKVIKTLSHPSNKYDRRDMILALDNIYNNIDIAFPEIEIDKEKIV
jgi:hypothetical protein